MTQSGSDTGQNADGENNADDLYVYAVLKEGRKGRDTWRVRLTVASSNGGKHFDCNIDTQAQCNVLNSETWS